MSKKLIIKIAGLHCRACELLSEEKLGELKNVSQVKVSQASGQAEIYYENEPPAPAAIKETLAKLGYRLENEPSEQIKPKKFETTWLSTLLIIAIVYLLINRFSLFDFSGWLNQKFSWPLALLVGLIAGISTCLALVGGLVLGLAANYSKDHPTATRQQKFRPQLFFNLGRISGFFILGGILGALGSILKPSPLFNGLLTVLVALVLFLLGFRLLEIFPGLKRLELALPKSWGKKIKTNNPLLLGGLTFFLPCGFTQAMQVYALSSGNFLNGGLIMFLFALGTAPGLLGIGGLSSLFRGQQAKTFFKIAGGIVIFFALINFNNGLTLIRVSANYNSQLITKNIPSETQDDLQIVRMTESRRGYTPNQFTIIKDRPVRWLIEAEAPYSCASALIVPSLKIEKQLQPGENIIEFTPTKAGRIPFSCSMGMYTGSFLVLEK